MNESKNILILGAAGFIGRTVAHSLTANNHTVLAATRKPAVFAGSTSISNVVSDFSAKHDFSPYLGHSSAVIHVASESTPASSMATPQIDGNLRTTLALIEALQDFPNILLIYMSSAGTLYGERSNPAQENDPIRPRSYHGAGKAAAEHFIHAWAAQYSGTAVILRPSNVYGPGQYAQQGFGVIPTAFDCALRGKPISVWDGSTVRDYLYVDDLVDLCAATLSHEFKKGTHVFNATFGEGVALDTLINRIEAVTGRSIQRDYQAARNVDIHTITADNSAARSAVGWSPKISLDEGLKRTWQWFSTLA